MGFTGFRRRWLITPGQGRVSAAVEDDYHCMSVTLCHDGDTITSVDAEMDRWPWTTCPGAEAVIRETFSGVKLAEAARRGEKSANCTHLYDLALLAANHAADSATMRYDAYVADPVAGVVEAELRRDGEILHRWTLEKDIFIAPQELNEVSLLAIRDWIAALSPEAREAARLLQWATLIAHGRSYPMDQQSDASRMPSNCYTFQPERKYEAVRIGQVFDFSEGAGSTPLNHFHDGRFVSRT